MLDGNDPELLNTSRLASRLAIHHAQLLVVLINQNVKPCGKITGPSGGWTPYWSEVRLPEIRDAIRKQFNL